MANESYLNTLRRDALRGYFESSPAVRLLRSELAPLVIDFLNQSFKLGDAIAISQSDLRLRLAGFQEELHRNAPSIMVGPPERYLAQWVDAGWLQRFLESGSPEAQYQLTSHAEEVIRFVDSSLARRQQLVGTESRLRMVIDALADIVRGASADPDRRLAFLKAQRDVIDREIAELEGGRSVQVYRPVQIRERFQTAVDLLKALQADFRAVEERFQAIARDVQLHQASGLDSRGKILSNALDAEDLLKQQDEGISFFAFVTFLISPAQQAALRKSIDEIQQLPTLADQGESLARLRRMVPSLLAEADKVMRTTARLSCSLRRLLDKRASAERQRLAEVLQRIMLNAVRLRNQTPADLAQLSPEVEINIASPMSRALWANTEQPHLEPLEPHVVDLSQVQTAAGMLAKMQRLDFRKLRQTIREGTYDGKVETLVDLLDRCPPQSGVVEILGYIQIAHDDGHKIDRSCTQSIQIEGTAGDGRALVVVVPQVTFVPKASSQPLGRKPR